MCKRTDKELKLHQSSLPQRLSVWFKPHTRPLPLIPSRFSTDRSKAVPFLQFFFVCASVTSYVAYVLRYCCIFNTLTRATSHDR